MALGIKKNLMETAPITESRKKIKVRKNISTEYKRNYDDEYHIPIAAQDSKWSGIAFTSQENKHNIEHACSSNEDECEIKIIDLEKPGITPPLLILFPDLRREESLEHIPTMSEQISTSSLTKLLRGKKPKMELLKTSKKLSLPLAQLSTVEEAANSRESVLQDIKPDDHLNLKENFNNSQKKQNVK